MKIVDVTSTIFTVLMFGNLFQHALTLTVSAKASEHEASPETHRRPERLLKFFLPTRVNRAQSPFRSPADPSPTIVPDPTTAPTQNPSFHPSSPPIQNLSPNPAQNLTGLMEDTQPPSVRPSDPPFLLQKDSPNPSSHPSSSPISIATSRSWTSPSNSTYPTTSFQPSRVPSTQSSESPTMPPVFVSTPPPDVVTYQPGNLTTFKDMLWLSEGLDSKLIARAGQHVQYHDGTSSNITFHYLPDAGACFVDTRESNPDGWVYVSNSEVRARGEGGVGSITFDKDGTAVDYRMVLEGSRWNCGGGKTPWNTWASCEESSDGQIYQVDPFGERPAQLMTLGSDFGKWESFAFDARNPAAPRFFVTEDHHRGALARFLPFQPDWTNTTTQWDMLHGEGVTEYLVLHPQPGHANGIFSWTSIRDDAKGNAELYYPNSEGIDVFENELFFVCKGIKMLFTLNLDDGTYSRASTVSGLFQGGPDQIKRIINDDSGLLYFTEDDGKRTGIHARDGLGRYFTILESLILMGETAGLAFSPDSKFMYLSYQDEGNLFAIWRRDGLPFHASHLDVKYHAQPER